MRSSSEVGIIDITEDIGYERYLYRCLAPVPFTKYRKRREYLEIAIPKGFHKKLLIFDGKIVGQIEYAPAEASGYPMIGYDTIVMNCIWVLRKAKGHSFGKRLVADMTESEKNAVGFATIALEEYWSPWFKRWQIEKFGFEPVDSIEVAHKTKHKGEPFEIYLMWLSKTKNAELPTWKESRLLKGVDFCLAHPLYHPQKTKLEEILEKH